MGLGLHYQLFEAENISYFFLGIFIAIFVYVVGIENRSNIIDFTLYPLQN